MDSNGIALVDRLLLQDLSHLWGEPLEPSNINNIDIALRAFMFAKRCVWAVSKLLD